MKQIIQQILEGNFRTDNTSVDFSCPRVDISLKPGDVEEGVFTIYAPEGALTEGHVISTDLRMECLTPSFSGSQDDIYYRVDASAMEIGDEIKGAFNIISNQGEYYLPFSVTVIKGAVTSSIGDIRNLFHFTNLAKSEWQEAVKLFYSKEFEQIFTGNDRQYYNAYKGLSKVYGNEHNVEEFLLTINKKKPVEFIPEEMDIVIENPEALARYALVINRNGWGYTQLRIETEGDFLNIDEDEISDDKFLGNMFRLYYYILDDRLHAGNNYGCIRLTSANHTITVPVTVVKRAESARKLHGIYKERKRVIVQLVQFYQNFRLKKISTKTWLDETGKLIDRLKGLYGKDLSTGLFQAHMYITQERFNEARWILEQDEEAVRALRDEKPEYFCYYLYLTALCSRQEEDTVDTAQVISRIYERNRGNWRIAWILLFIADEYINNASRRWTLFEELFENKCNSPIFYMEAWNVLAMNPAMLLKLDEFELQILNYAAKNELLKDDVVIQLIYLAQKRKDFSRILFDILVTCYDKKPQNDILQAICTILIKGNLYGEKYLKWYRLGVEQNLRITGLYEFYMKSLSLDGKETLPKMVLMYFSYQSDLNYEITAYLYAYVHKRKDMIPEIYINYLPAMERFVIEQIKNGRINKHLAYLYRNILTRSMVDEETAKGLVSLIFTQDIIIESDEVRQVILVYPYAAGQMAYAVSGRHAQVPIYDEECRIILEDGYRNRYASSIHYHTERLLAAGNLMELAKPYINTHLGYDIHMCYANKNSLVVSEDNAEQFKHLADTDFLLDKYRQEIRIKLVKYYYDTDRTWELDEYLSTLRLEDIASNDRKEVVRIMVLRGMYEEAYEWVLRIGPYGMDAKTLVRMSSRLLAEDVQEENVFMTEILHYVMKRGKYDENVLKYLIRFYNGSTKDMRDIWKAACDFGVEPYELSERIIIQMLYTGSYVGEKMDIFSSYMKAGGRDEVILAFICQCCYDYVIHEKITEPFLFKCIQGLSKEKEDMHKVCKLAYLKYYAENRSEITEEIKLIICVLLQDMLSQQIILPLFKEYHGYLPALDILQDKSILEYRAAPGHRATIHYLIHKEGDKGQEYSRENMKDMFGGICVKEFILFFGERLQYYITEEVDGREQVTQSGTISRSDIGDEVHESSRFGMLNDIMIGKTLQDYDTVDSLLEEYYKKDFMADMLFKAI
ncbi:MAG: DUF5717 family protein [Clostridiales bacterium]|nr:DUF5717 family protein [Clostridiales bacterium]